MRGEKMGSLKITTFILMILVLYLNNVNMAVNPAKSVHHATNSSIIRDYWPTEQWQNSTPEEQGMNSVLLENMIDYIDEESFNIDSIIVIRHGYIVLEEYPTSLYNENRSHYWYSVTKSFTSSLIGIALDNGYIDNVSQTVLSFFPERDISNWDERKERITLENLLTMRSGLFWDESSAPFTSPENGIFHLMNRDGVQYVLELNMTSEPGEEWHYNTGASHLLSAIVQQTTGLTALDFAREYLFEPLGISNVFWSSDASGVTRGGFDLYIRPRAAAKFGYLFLNNGTWDGTQIISHDWINASTSTFTKLDTDTGYGYQWWTSLGYYYAAGLYGQYIFVTPDKDLVVVFSSNIRQGEYPHERLLRDYILSAILDDTSSVLGLDISAISLLAAIFVPIAFVALYCIYKTRKR
jgi:CubicO group peptidase (beta-lactamase class C family)